MLVSWGFARAGDNPTLAATTTGTRGLVTPLARGGATIRAALQSPAVADDVFVSISPPPMRCVEDPA